MDKFSIMTGTGTLYVAAANTAPPTLGTNPSSSWRNIGETQDGVEVDLSQKIELTRTDQRTGPVKATREEEAMKLKTKLAELTVENLAMALGNSVTDTAPGVGTIGTRKVYMYRGAGVEELALLFIGSSPYLDGPGAYYVPRAYIDMDSLKYDKAKNTPIPITIEALEDLNAATADERFGYFIAQDALALP